MPLPGFQSICNPFAPQIVSRDVGHRQYHMANNQGRVNVTQYKIDGVVVTAGKKCDFLVMNEEKKIAYLIELKGSDLVQAAEQLEATEKALQQALSSYDLRYRIVTNKCKTQEIRTSEYRKYQIRWKGRLMLRTGCIEEKI